MISELGGYLLGRLLCATDVLSINLVKKHRKRHFGIRNVLVCYGYERVFYASSSLYSLYEYTLRGPSISAYSHTHTYRHMQAHTYYIIYIYARGTEKESALYTILYESADVTNQIATFMVLKLLARRVSERYPMLP